jgi:ABC-2 type transport system permease protein
MTANLELQRVKENPKLRGFRNLLRKETRAWWNTRLWWINALLWTIILSGLLAIMIYGPNNEFQEASAAEIAAAGGELAFILDVGLNIFFQFGVAVTAIGVIVLSQDVIISEKQNGLAEWLLSKPVNHQSYLLAKLAATIPPILLLVIGLPSVVTYILLSIRMGAPFPVLPFWSGVGIMVIHTLFYLTLTLMLGTIFQSRGPILGIALGSALGGGMIGGFIKPLLSVTPWMLPKVATLTASGQALPPEVGIVPILASLVWSVVFTGAAVIFFQRTEF